MEQKKRALSFNSGNENSRESCYVHMAENFLLVWLDGSVNESDNEEYTTSITKLRQVVNTVKVFADIDECIEFINGLTEAVVFMIASGALGEKIVPIVHDKLQVNTIYIYCGYKARHEIWAEKWLKVRGVFTEIDPIYEALKEAVQEYNQNSISISFVKSRNGDSSENLDQLDQSFMYTQILKEILLTIDFERQHFNEFVQYCQEQFVGNSLELENVDILRKKYPYPQPIWWFTYHCFLFGMLNKALRTMEVDLIIKMGFFIRDLHKHIAQLHQEQYDGRDYSHPFVVYRGQGLTTKDFEQLVNSKGGLLSFNAFLSTSKNRNVSLDFAFQTASHSNMVGILFIMKIDPSKCSTPFANVQEVSAYPIEEEILFSMHSVFRIGNIKQISKNDHLWEVHLTLTSDNDPELHALAESLRKETSSSHIGWDRLGILLINLGHFNKAEELYNILLQQTNKEDEKAYLLYNLGRVKHHQGNYTQAIAFYEKSIETGQRILHPDHPDLATTYSNMGLAYRRTGEYSKALSYYTKDLDIKLRTLNSNHPSLATIYNNIGTVYNKMGENHKALSSHKKALEIRRDSLPSNHPDLATSYNNIGCVYSKRSEFSKALDSYNAALQIEEKSLPSNHPDLGTTYTNIGSVYFKMSKYSKALSFFERAVHIGECSLAADHPQRQQWESNLEIVKKKM